MAVMAVMVVMAVTVLLLIALLFGGRVVGCCQVPVGFHSQYAQCAWL